MNRYTKANTFTGAVLLFAALTMTSISRKESVAKNMSNPHEQSHSSLLQALVAPGRSKEITDREDIYGWLIGDWEATGSEMMIQIDPETGALFGAADPRRDGYAVGW